MSLSVGVQPPLGGVSQQPAGSVQGLSLVQLDTLSSTQSGKVMLGLQTLSFSPKLKPLQLHKFSLSGGTAVVFSQISGPGSARNSSKKSFFLPSSASWCFNWIMSILSHSWEKFLGFVARTSERSAKLQIQNVI